MKKYLILLAIMLMGNAARAGHALRLDLAGGTAATYILSSRPVVTYSDGSVTIKNASLEDTYSLGEVKSFAFVENMTSLSSAVSGEVVYDFRDNVFTCEGNEIRVYDLSGVLVAQGNGSVSLDGTASGVYIVSAAGRSIKIFKK